MNQTEFIKNELLGSLYFNLEKSNPKEFENLLYNFRTKHDISVLLVEYGGN